VAKGTFDICSIHCQHQSFTIEGTRGVAHQRLLELTLVNLTQLQGLIQTVPFTLKARGKGQFQNRMGLAFGQKSISQIKQGVTSVVEAAVDFVPKFFKGL
jgi:hypothetical protein